MAFPTIYVWLDEAARQCGVTPDELLQQGMVSRLTIYAEVDIYRLDLKYAKCADDPNDQDTAPGLPLIEMDREDLQRLKATGMTTKSLVVYPNIKLKRYLARIRQTRHPQATDAYVINLADLCVMTHELEQFKREHGIAVVNACTGNDAKPLGDRERNTLLTIIAALAKHAEIDITKPYEAAKIIEAMTDEFGQHVGSDTIANKLKLITDPLQARRK